MDFKTKKIKKNREKPPKIPKPKTHSKKRLRIKISVLSSLIIIFLLSIGIVKALNSIDFKVFLKVAGDELITDAYNHTNFLILGTGGKDHEGADLTDTIILASLDNEEKLVTMISIPRDIFVKDNIVGNSKINEVYYNAKNYYESSTEGLEHMKEKVEIIMGVPIHYWIKIDFDGFKELIDALDGIDVYVDEAINDPYYPKDGTFKYETFRISAGQHHLDGETALKYARSRKTTSDFDRADRQQKIIFAIKEKALQTNTLLSKEKITGILDALKNNIETNITVKEILTLGSLAGDYGEEQITQHLIHDDPTKCGGFLYTPAREFYGGLFVLVPAGGFEFIHLYSDLNFNSPKIVFEDAKIHLLNGTPTAGVAGEAKQILKRFCFNISQFGNAREQNITETTYYYRQKYDQEGNKIDSRPEAINFLQKLIPGKESTDIPKEYFEKGYHQTSDLIIEIGTDYVNSDKYIDDPFYNLPDAISPNPIAGTNLSSDEDQ